MDGRFKNQFCPFWTSRRPASWCVQAGDGFKLLSRLSIERTFHADARLLHNMGVNLGGGQFLVTEKVLHRADVRAGLQKMSGETVAQDVRRYPFIQPRPNRCLPDGVLKRCIQHMMPPPQARAGVIHPLA